MLELRVVECLTWWLLARVGPRLIPVLRVRVVARCRASLDRTSVRHLHLHPVPVRDRLLARSL